MSGARLSAPLKFSSYTSVHYFKAACSMLYIFFGGGGGGAWLTSEPPRRFMIPLVRHVRCMHLHWRVQSVFFVFSSAGKEPSMKETVVQRNF